MTINTIVDKPPYYTAKSGPFARQKFTELVPLAVRWVGSGAEVVLKLVGSETYFTMTASEFDANFDDYS